MWAIFGICGMLVLGIGDFLKKLALSRGVEKEVFLFMSFVLYIFLFFLNFLIQGNWHISQSNLLGAFLIGTTDFLTPLGMLVSLKYLNVSYALVSIRLISSFCLLFVGLFVLGDYLSIYNFVGFFMGAIAIFLLSGFRTTHVDAHSWKGNIALGITTISIIISHSYLKYIVERIENIHTFMFVKFLVSFLWIILYMVIRKKFVYLSFEQVKKSSMYVCIGGFLFVIHFLYFLPSIYLNGPLSLSYKMLSYSLVVPILLSIIFLGEKINITKIIAFALTIFSIALFII